MAPGSPWQGKTYTPPLPPSLRSAHITNLTAGQFRLLHGQSKSALFPRQLHSQTSIKMEAKRQCVSKGRRWPAHLPNGLHLAPRFPLCGFLIQTPSISCLSRTALSTQALRHWPVDCQSLSVVGICGDQVKQGLGQWPGVCAHSGAIQRLRLLLWLLVVLRQVAGFICIQKRTRSMADWATFTGANCGDGAKSRMLWRYPSRGGARKATTMRRQSCDDCCCCCLFCSCCQTTQHS
ncbi:hypothetical protein GQ54DRAFT_114828 [Martensiomyces pterosporus]|nr:hypothetical protein GQ54DRAFT_114828 [Martensiomyces pterosporus]